MNAHNISSKIWIVFSDCLLVWGWKAVLNVSFTPKALCRLLEKWAMNRESRLETMVTRMPWSITIWSIYISASFFKDKPILIAKKWADLVSLSITTRTLSKPFFGLSKTGHKIHSYVFWLPLRNRKRFDKFYKSLMLNIYLLTSQILHHDLFNLSFHVVP